MAAKAEGGALLPGPDLLLLRRRLPLNSERQRVAGSWPWRGDLHAGTPGALLRLPLLWPSLRHLSRPTPGGGGEVTGYHVCCWFQGALPCFPATSERKRPPVTGLRSGEGGSLTSRSSSKEPRFSQTDLQEPRSPSNLCFLPGGAANSEGEPKAEETQEHLHLLCYNQLLVFLWRLQSFWEYPQNMLQMRIVQIKTLVSGTGIQDKILRNTLLSRRGICSA